MKWNFTYWHQAAVIPERNAMFAVQKNENTILAPITCKHESRLRHGCVRFFSLFRWWLLIYLFLWVDLVILLAFSVECRTKKPTQEHLQYIPTEKQIHIVKM